MNNQQILDNAPEGATHVDTEGRWHRLTCNHKGFMLLNNDGDWDYCNPCTDLRSLADIKLIAELEKERDAAVNRVEMCNLSDWKIYQETDFGKKMLAIRDLEQQAKGVYNLRSTTGFWDLSTCLSRTHLREYEVILKNKANALKGARQ